MQLLVAAEESERFLAEELKRAIPSADLRLLAPDVLASDSLLSSSVQSLPLAFIRQWLPDVAPLQADSIEYWSELLVAKILHHLPEDQPWRLHLAPRYESGTGGANRCQWIRAAVRESLGKRRRILLRRLHEPPEPFGHTDSLVQLLLTSPDEGFLSFAIAPRPWQSRQILSPWVLGDIPVANDKAAPSRAFAKLVEAEIRLGARIEEGDTCVDLGASPGSWSYVALHRGAQVTAVDRAPLREDLMRHPRLTFQQGDAFSYRPEAPVDWLLCDVIAAPERSIGLVLEWLRERWARCFVVTIKFKGHEEYRLLDELKAALPAEADEFFLTRLCANKNEVCVFGRVRGMASP